MLYSSHPWLRVLFRCLCKAQVLPSLWFKVVAWAHQSPHSYKSPRQPVWSPWVCSRGFLPSWGWDNTLWVSRWLCHYHLLLHCRVCLNPWWMPLRTSAPVWWKKPTSDKTWSTPAPKRFPSHAPLLKMSSWNSLELTFLTKLGMSIVLLNWRSCRVWDTVQVVGRTTVLVTLSSRRSVLRCV